MFTRADGIVMRDYEPVSLAKQELELDTEPLTRMPVPIAVQAWLHYRTIVIRVEAELVVWTPRACAIRRKSPASVEHRAWVWANAVEKL